MHAGHVEKKKGRGKGKVENEMKIIVKAKCTKIVRTMYWVSCFQLKPA